MDKQAIIERVARAMYESYDLEPPAVQRSYLINAENALYAANYWEIVEAANDLLLMAHDDWTTYHEDLKMALRKAGVLDE